MANLAGTHPIRDDRSLTRAWRPRLEQVPGLVSVIVPVFNREQLVGRTLESILAQTYRSLEILAVDDGSEDGSLALLRRYSRERAGLVTVLSQRNSGQAAARNRGVEASRGEFIAFLDSDDLWRPDKLDRQIPLFAGPVGLVYSAIHEIDSAGRVLRTVACEAEMRGDIHSRLLVRNRMTGGTVVVRRSALERVGLFDENLRAAENWDLWIRVCREFEADFVDRPLVEYLKHESNLSRDEQRLKEASISVLRKHFPSPPQVTDPMRQPYDRGYANYYYRWGVELYSSGDYSGAREMFRRCWVHIPGYEDSRGRYLRSFLGRRVNSLLSRIRKLLPQSKRRAETRRSVDPQ